MTGKLAHFEIAGRDGEALEAFYSGLFGWSVERRDAGGFPYGDLKDAADGGVTGGVRHEPEGEPEIVLYVSVPDVDAAFRKAQEMGAGVRIPPMEAGDVRFALVTDPEGNPLGLLQQ